MELSNNSEQVNLSLSWYGLLSAVSQGILEEEIEEDYSLKLYISIAGLTIEKKISSGHIGSKNHY
jgi:hypothetical protein